MYTTFLYTYFVANDYPTFGMLVPNRHVSSSAYRYGFQGQEMDNEIKGEGNSLNYTFRMHDPRVGRFFAVDPLTGKYPYYSPYSFSGNKVIQFGELEGQEEKIVTLSITTGGDGERFVTHTSVKINQDVNFEIAGKHYARTLVGYVLDGKVSSQVIPFYEEIGNGALVPSAAYDYTKSTIDGKFTDDWSYILKGDPVNTTKFGHNAVTRAFALSMRDDMAPDNIENLQDLEEFGITIAVLAIPLQGSATKVANVKSTKPPRITTNDLVKSSKLVSPKTTGPEVTYSRTGNYNKAVEEFNSLEGISNIKSITGSKFKGYTGTLPNGNSVTVRSGSSGNAPGTSSSPTIQINPARGNSGQKQKIRYDSE
ncbi:RHS repeat-associated core domain-containing protein [Flavobacterium sp. N2270]|uniref:RHS repeat-associated core domain-containing protein n=1 Tax=Flavobacterium sp. N2270 TaxID=2986831 RepID=UPI002224F110|nr:RHS repeat-associated core domain-containing protein [Flavobacterium sp. N2270]